MTKETILNTEYFPSERKPGYVAKRDLVDLGDKVIFRISYLKKPKI